MLDEQAKKTLLRKIPHGLYICGVRQVDDLNGFTASWVMQASFTPPLVVNCVKNDSSSHAMIKASGVFALSFLEAGQKDLAQRFFKPLRRMGNKFEDIEFYPGPETGCPIIQDTLGYLECRVTGSVEQGDHTVFVAEVIGASLHRQGDPCCWKLRVGTTAVKIGAMGLRGGLKSERGAQTIAGESGHLLSNYYLSDLVAANYAGTSCKQPLSLVGGCLHGCFDCL
ncbi:MAG: flavin reductase family protein [Nodosilinea sp. LVE1205-7]